MKIYSAAIDPHQSESGFSLAVHVQVASFADALLVQAEISKLLERMASASGSKRAEIARGEFYEALSVYGPIVQTEDGCPKVELGFDLQNHRYAEVVLRNGNCNVSVGGGAFGRDVARNSEAYFVSCDEMRYQFLYDACKRAAHLVIEDQERSKALKADSDSKPRLVITPAQFTAAFKAYKLARNADDSLSAAMSFNFDGTVTHVTVAYRSGMPPTCEVLSDDDYRHEIRPVPAQGPEGPVYEYEIVGHPEGAKASSIYDACRMAAALIARRRYLDDNPFN